MNRVLGISKAIASLLAVELLVPGGTLIVLAVLLTNRPGSPLLRILEQRCPALFGMVSRVSGNLPVSLSLPTRR